jgi:hypothetical protein
MNTRTSDSLATQHVRGRLAAVLFGFVLIAYVVESQLTQVSSRWDLPSFGTPYSPQGINSMFRRH